MTRTHSHKGRLGSGYQVPNDDILEGTSARTRPLSYDDVMLIRNNKRDGAKGAFSSPEEADVALERDELRKNHDIREHHMQINEESVRMDVRYTSNDSQKVSSRRTWDSNATLKDDKLVQDKDVGYRHRNFRLKSVWERVDISKNEDEGENERGHQSNRRTDRHVGVDSHDVPNKRESRDSYRKDTHFERGRSEVDRKQVLDNERQLDRVRKTKQRMSDSSEKEYKRRNEQDVNRTERLLTNRGRDNIKTETRHRRHSEEDKTKNRNMNRRDVAERKDHELPRAFLEESRAQRRRSRSRERGKERSRRSRSYSPKTHRHTLSDKRKHGEMSSLLTNDIPGREHSDVDKKWASTNGSNSHSRRNIGPSSGLGGYSPRKRKTDAAAKTPSPTRRSPEKKTAGWDLLPAEKESIVANTTLPNLQVLPPRQNLALNVMNFPSVVPVASAMVMRPNIVVSHSNMSSHMHTIDSVQLTQATRPMRRLYVENLPSSAGENDLTECINKHLLSSGVNYIRGTQPCISCIIHKEKNQALLEFLTPEDATSALSLDGVSFSGSSLKLRRPKDFASVSTGLTDKVVVAVDSISDIVEDSPHKIFIGGISKRISSKMLLDIARAFGTVNAFRFEFSADLNAPCAFLEYLDKSVSSKARAGLNGMKLGGQVVSAVFAAPETNMENVGKPSFYGIPEHAKPLLVEPTSVLKLKNVLDPEGLPSLSESELENILEDIKLECSRFGAVKSINVAMSTNTVSTMEVCEVKIASTSTHACNIEAANRSNSAEHTSERINPVGELNQSALTKTYNQSDNLDETLAGDAIKDEISTRPSHGENDFVDKALRQECSGSFTREFADEQNDSAMETKTDIKIEPLQSEEDHDAKIRSCGDRLKLDESNFPGEGSTKDVLINLKDAVNKPLVERNFQFKEGNAKFKKSVEELKFGENNAPGEVDQKKLENVCEPGCVYVEYRRPEAACMAAHCLHGRTFDGRVVTIGYVDHDLYQTRFRK